MASALVLDGNLKSALCVVRELGKEHVRVICGAKRRFAMGLHSKYVAELFVYTAPEVSQDAFIEAVLTQAKKQIAQDGQKPVVYCFSDATLTTLVERYNEVSQYVTLSLPSLESFAIASDKKATYLCAQKLSIPTIRTYEEHEFDSVSYPCVVKNRHSIVWKNSVAKSGSATFVFSKKELDVVYKKVTDETGETPLVQAFIKGDEYGVEMVCDTGIPLATFVHRRIRGLSPKGGAGVVKETATETSEVRLMKMYAQALVKQLSWHGPIMVEFKIDTTSGGVRLMEINGRFWGSLPLAVKAGIQFPLMVYELGVGNRVAQSSEAFVPPYVRTRHFLADCKWLWQVFFKKDKLRSYIYPSRIRALYDFKKEIFLSKGDVFAIDDLKPSFIEYLDILTK
jgi:predicted ATP-grasp superfamily ATP-dependent carboligase